MQARGTQWTITDVQFTRDGRNFVYSSINPTLHLCNVSAGVEQHVAMRLGDHFGIWSMRISADGSQVDFWLSKCAGVRCSSTDVMQVVAGTNNTGMVLYDMQRESCLANCSGESKRSHMPALLRTINRPLNFAPKHLPPLFYLTLSFPLARQAFTRATSTRSRSSTTAVKLFSLEAMTHSST